MLTFQHVEKRFGPRPILNIPSLHLDAGIYWLHGANGSGKSTLLRILAGILPFRGEITLLGRHLHKDPTGYRRLIGWADAEPLYPAFLTGTHLLNFYTGILHPDAARTQLLIDAFGVRPFLPTRVSSWSSGMTKKLARLCLRTAALLFLPVSAYTAIILGIAIARKEYLPGGLCVVYIVVLTILGGIQLQHLLRHAGSPPEGLTRPSRRPSLPYFSILFRYWWLECRGLLLEIKLLSCIILYFTLISFEPADPDLSIPLLAFSPALFGHSILFYRSRRLESVRLIGYRSLPVPLIRRFGQYAGLCFAVLLPETAILGWLTSHPLPPQISGGFWLAAYSLLLMLNSILLAWSLSATNYGKCCLVLFGILYVGVLGKLLIVSSVLFLLSAVSLFFWRYYRYEEG